MNNYKIYSFIIIYIEYCINLSARLIPFNSIQLTPKFTIILQLNSFPPGSPDFTCSIANYLSYNEAISHLNDTACPTIGFKLWNFNVTTFKVSSIYFPLSVTRSVNSNISTTDYLNLCCAQGIKLYWAISVVYLSPYLPIDYNLATNSPEMINYPIYYDMAPCPCNLTAKECDINCCCDKECNENDLSLFKCIPGPFGGNVISAVNDPNQCNSFAYFPPWLHFLCIVRQNSAYLGNFFAPTTSLPSLPKYSPGLKENIYSGDKSNEPDYKMGLAVATVLRVNGTLKSVGGPNYYLTLPQITSHGCSWNRAVRYLKDFSNKCSLAVTGGLEICNQVSRLSISMYLNLMNMTGLSVLSRRRSSPLFLAPTTVNYYCADSNYILKLYPNVLKPNYFREYFFPPTMKLQQQSRPPKCSWNIPHLPTCSANCSICNNAVIEVLYLFKWNGSVIHNVNVEIIVANISLSVANVYQNFSVRFEHINDANNDTDETTLNIKGYNIKSPIITGKLNSSMDFYVNTNYTDKSSLWNPDSNGLCITSTQTSNILFLSNSVNQCFVFVKASSFSNCSQLRTKMLDGLNSLMPSNLIAIIQNPLPTNDSHWIPIYRDNVSYIEIEPFFNDSLNNTSLNNYTKIENICDNIPSDIQMQILYSKIGEINGEDLIIIVGAKIKYKFSTWRFLCKSGNDIACTSLDLNTSQQFLISSSSLFVDAKQLSLQLSSYEVKRNEVERICFEDTCWSNLFYPFIYKNIGQSSQYRVLATLIFFLIIIIMILGSYFLSNLSPSNLKITYM